MKFIFSFVVIFTICSCQPIKNDVYIVNKTKKDIYIDFIPKKTAEHNLYKDRLNNELPYVMSKELSKYKLEPNKRLFLISFENHNVTLTHLRLHTPTLIIYDEKMNKIVSIKTLKSMDIKEEFSFTLINNRHTLIMIENNE